MEVARIIQGMKEIIYIFGGKLDSLRPGVNQSNPSGNFDWAIWIDIRIILTLKRPDKSHLQIPILHVSRLRINMDMTDITLQVCEMDAFR